MEMKKSFKLTQIYKFLTLVNKIIILEYNLKHDVNFMLYYMIFPKKYKQNKEEVLTEASVSCTRTKEIFREEINGDEVIVI